MTLADIAHLFAGLCWVAVWLFFVGSVVRTVRGRGEMLDAVWSLFWFLSGHQLGYVLRWLNDWSYTPVDSTDSASLVGLHLMSAMLAMGAFYHRFRFEGFRW